MTVSAEEVVARWVDSAREGDLDKVAAGKEVWEEAEVAEVAVGASERAAKAANLKAAKAALRRLAVKWWYC